MASEHRNEPVIRKSEILTRPQPRGSIPMQSPADKADERRAPPPPLGMTASHYANSYFLQLQLIADHAPSSGDILIWLLPYVKGRTLDTRRDDACHDARCSLSRH